MDTTDNRTVFTGGIVSAPPRQELSREEMQAKQIAILETRNENQAEWLKQERLDSKVLEDELRAQKQRAASEADVLRTLLGRHQADTLLLSHLRDVLVRHGCPLPEGRPVHLAVVDEWLEGITSGISVVKIPVGAASASSPPDLPDKVAALTRRVEAMEKAAADSVPEAHATALRSLHQRLEAVEKRASEWGLPLHNEVNALRKQLEAVHKIAFNLNDRLEDVEKAAAGPAPEINIPWLQGLAHKVSSLDRAFGALADRQAALEGAMAHVRSVLHFPETSAPVPAQATPDGHSWAEVAGKESS